MKRKNVAAGVVIMVALLLPLGKWVIAARQDTNDQKRSLEIERKYASQRGAPGNGIPQGGGPGMWAGAGQPGAGQPGSSVRRRWRGGQGGDGPRGGGPGDGQRGQGRQRMMTAMATEVGLTPKQIEQVQAIQRSSRPLMGDVFRNPKLSQEQKQAAMQTIQQAQKEQMSKFMTPDQMQKYDAMREKMRSQWQARRQGQNGTNGTTGTGGQR